jgi:nucleoside phosphorylase
VDIGIVTIRDDEFRAVLGAFPDKVGMHRGRHREYALRHADAGGGERYTLAILRQIEQGNGEAQTATRDLIDDLAPRLLVIVGIAGGLPSDDVTLGDVVLSTRIHDFTVAAHRPGETSYAVTGGSIDGALAAALANLAAREDEMGDWTAELPAPPPVAWQTGQLYGPPEWQRELREKLEHHHGAGAVPRVPRYIAGPIASSDRLVKDPAQLFPWITAARSMLAIEMESGGAYRAARDCPMLAIRGISDLVGLRRADAWTRFACGSAAAFTRAFLRTRPVELGDGAARGDRPAPTWGPRAAPTSTASPGSTAVPTTRELLLDRLSALLPSQFEAVVFLANIPPADLPGSNAPQSLRAIEAIRYFARQGQLEQLARILHRVVGP